MEVMAQGGDRVGWRAVSTPDGMAWYCTKLPCRQAHDEFIAGARAEIPKQETISEMAALQNRIRELEAELAALKGGAEQAEAPEHLKPKPVVSTEIHADLDGNGKAACGATTGVAKKPDEMDIDDDVCDDCVSIFAERSKQKATGKTAPPAKAEVVEVEPPQATVEEAQVDLPPPRADIDYSKVPRFGRDLIGRINDGFEVDGPILLTPKSYPKLDFAKVRPEQLTDAISGFFKDGLEVDSIERAYGPDEALLGFAFTLKKTGSA